MPLAALALKENLAGAVGFKTADNEHSAPSLGDSEVASIESAPRHAVPEPVHFVKEPSKITPLIGSEEPWDILQHDPPRSSLLNKVKVGECEAAPLAAKSGALACRAEVLAGEPA